MGGKVTALDVRMAAALAGGVPNVAEFCRVQGISRETFYKWRRRFAAEGLAGLEERSRRPLRSPGSTPAAVEELIVRLRGELAAEGLDCGPQSIGWRLAAELGAAAPSRATIARVLTRRGLVARQPRKRPRASLHRFAAARVNEMWQSDWTAWALADGTAVAIAGTLDDCSRYCLALRAAAGDATAALVWDVMLAGIGELGVPARSLTDNGLVYSGRRRGVTAAFEANLRALGVTPISSSPYHPQTCGKIERFWQTLKRWLAARPRAHDLDALARQLEEFRDHYNHRRPHRSLHGATPAAVAATTARARPAASPLPAPVTVTDATVAPNGVLPVGRYLINVGSPWIGHRLTAVTDGDHITVFAGTTLVRDLTADPAKTYQRAAAPNQRRGHREPMPPSLSAMS